MRFGVIETRDGERFAVLEDDYAYSERVPELLPASIDEALTVLATQLRRRLTSVDPRALTRTRIGPDARVLAPLGRGQEVWAAGVTYERSLDARTAEAAEHSVYDRVYDAERPELFHKAVARRVAGPGGEVGIRSDSTWNVPEPELALVVNAHAEIVGYTLGNDMSSRSIEGENPLYLPQAKIYERSCAIGPAILPAWEVGHPEDLVLTMHIERQGQPVFSGETRLVAMRRSFESLVGYLFSALAFPNGVLLLTGTGIVPPDAFTLAAGDVVRIRCDGVGVLENTVVVV
jgi:2-dehydro-3-deoxy-D-arabinonate dehydratase